MSRVLSIAKSQFGQAYLLNKNRRSGAHAHSDAHIMLQIEGVNHEYLVGEENVHLRRDTAVLVNQHVLHGNLSVGDGHSIVLMFYLSPQWITDHFTGPLFVDRLFSNASVHLSPQQRRQSDLLAERMLQTDEINDPDIGNLCQSLIESFVTRRAPGIKLDKLSDHRIRRAVALMNETFEEPLSASELASRVGLSRSRYFDLFRACTGLSPVHYYKMLRLEHARRRLSTGRESIADISRQCGFGAQSHFSNFFAEQLGITPSEFRRAAMSSSRSAGRHA